MDTEKQLTTDEYINNNMLSEDTYTKVKYCRKCDQIHTVGNFYNSNRAKDGYDTYCKGCRDDYSIKWKSKNIAYYREYVRAWRAENRDRVAKYNYNRLALERSQTVKDFTDKDWELVLEQFNYSCAYCGISQEQHYYIYNENLHKEHIVDIGSGGNYTLGNIVPACRRCNSQKGRKSFEEWYPNTIHYSRFKHEIIIDYMNSSN